MNADEREALADDVHDELVEQTTDYAWADKVSKVLARRLLNDSDWLRDHDARVRAEERERIAQAIEKAAERFADTAWELSRDPHELRGAQEMFAAKCLADAARIARADREADA